MNIDQLSREYEIAPEVREIAGLVEDVSGKELDVQLVVNLGTDGSTKIAREKMPRHIVKVRENNTSRVNHIIAHECGHIMRTIQAAPAERVIPSSNTETSAAAFRDLQAEMASVPENSREQLFTLWTGGMINQLVNLPVDVRIERWLYDSYPSFRDMQRKSLAIDVNNSLGGLSEKVASITIKPVFEKSNAMIYAYLRGLTPVTREDYAPYFKKHQDIKKLGRKLYKHLEEEDKGFAQDIEIINAWAEILGIDSWFEWIGFEDVPESYYEG